MKSNLLFNFQKAGADFVKTSTGFNKVCATVEDIDLIRCVVGSFISMKAAGSIDHFSEALGMIKTGANRIGTSTVINIINEY